MVGAWQMDCYGLLSFQNRELLSGRNSETLFPGQVSLGLLPSFGIVCSLVLAAEFGFKTLLLELKCQACQVYEPERVYLSFLPHQSCAFPENVGLLIKPASQGYCKN